ncbi:MULTISPECIES: N-(5'-phosphoribosyl)anthranilate isomerase [Tabrizicola]|uniref:N-(5'-phosphoribosyl)anthranilate isomerase n=1 Tax=Tabrizicola soli TaxID=2185115 RepID=A0ABV7DZV7_9RHOB|nr:N-(5'-phosphoribosyl)anthranilate isomerase [Tabrizicola soli]
MSMMQPVSPQQFLAELFSSRAAATGAVIRRNARDVDRFVGREAFLEEMRRRGFSVVENAGQLVIFCNREPLRRLA